jgi:hypothetical protein
MLNLTGELNELAGDINYWSHEKGHWEAEEVPCDGHSVAMPRDPITKLMLIVQEVTEAFDEMRDGHAVDEVYWKWVEGPNPQSIEVKMWEGNQLYYNTVTSKWDLATDAVWVEHGYVKKPEGVPVEIADIIIRALDFMHEMGIDVEETIRQKMQFNWTRPYRHGRKI